jgi:hypothetical protein
VLGGEALDDLGKAEAVEAGSRREDAAEDETDRPPLPERVDPEPAEGRDRVREVGVVLRLELLGDVVAHDGARHLGSQLGSDVGRVFEATQRAVDPNARGRTDLHMEVRAIRFRQPAKHVVEQGMGHVSGSAPREGTLTSTLLS